jgi:hypothetical protein
VKISLNNIIGVIWCIKRSAEVRLSAEMLGKTDNWVQGAILLINGGRCWQSGGDILGQFRHGVEDLV